MKAFIILFSLLGFISAVHAEGNEGASGGDGVLIDNQLYLIDFVEAGVEEHPNVNEALEQNPAYPQVLARVASPLSRLNDAAANRLVALKLIEISKVSTPLALTILHAMEAYSWKLVNHQLVDVKDEDTLLELGQNTLKQLAIRRLHSIMVSRESWAQLNPANRAGLILHESVYAIIDLENKKEIRNNVAFEYSFQSSPKARELVGALYLEDIRPSLNLAIEYLTIKSGINSSGPEKYYEELPSLRDTTGNRAYIFDDKWRVKIVGYNRVERAYPSIEKFFGEARNLTSETFKKDICDDAVRLVKANEYSWSIQNIEIAPINPPYYSYWSTFINREQAESTIRKTKVDSASWAVYVNFRNNKAVFSSETFTYEYCTELMGEEITALQQERIRPNVFWNNVSPEM